MNSRIDTFNQILHYATEHHVRLNRFWGSFIETARFKLGESIKDIKIPFSLDSESTQIIQESLSTLADFLKRRHEVQFKAPTDHSIDDFVANAKLAPKTYLLRPYRKESLEHSIVSRILTTDPLLDAGIFETWFGGQKGNGSRLLAIVQGILNKSFVEEIKSDHLEKSAFIAFLGLIKHFNHAKSVIKQKSIKGIQYEQLDVTFANIIYVILSSSLHTIIENLKTRRLKVSLEHTFLLLSSSCHPLAFTSIKPSILRFRFNPYNISQDLVDQLDPLYRQVSQKDTDLNFVHTSMLEKILSAPKLKNTVLGEALLLKLRVSILDFLFENDHPTSAVASRFRELIQDHTALYQLVCEQRAIAQISDQLKGIIRQENKGEKRTEQLSEIEAILRFLHKGSLFKKSSFPQEMVEQMVHHYLSYKIDLYVDQFTSEAQNLLDNRQIKMNVTQLKQDYDSGRLYRISTDPQPLIQGFVEKVEGQLFIDLKDFTKRTHFSKEIAMAEFLGTEFYKPILDAAKKHHATVAQPDKSIELVNLLGDAVIFSGNIESLVYLAQDIQNIFKDYRNKLKASSPTNLEHELKDKIETRYKRGMEQIQTAILNARQKHQTLKKDVLSRIQKNFATYSENFPLALSQEITKLEADFLSSDAKLSNEADLHKRYDYSSQKNFITQKLTSLRGLQKQYVSGFTKLTADQQSDLMAKFFCRDLYTEINAVEETLETLQKREMTLRYEFERDIKKIEGFGMEAGLFISFGAAAEVVSIRDEAWGDQEVAIAETINESARGTARNPAIKKMLDARLAEQTRLRGKSDLNYPYHVFVEKTFSFQLSPRQNAEFNSALKNNNLQHTEQILHSLLYESLKDAREQMSAQTSPDERRSLVVLRDLYNEGEAISEDALNAFMKETATSRYNLKRSFPVRKFHQQILEQFLFLIDTFQFVLSLNQQNPKQDPLIFRYAGDLTFRGFENRGSTGIYELLKFDSAFYQMIMKYHLTDWIRELDPTLA